MSAAQCRKGSGADLTAVDLFSGLGGTTLGLEQAGFRVIAAVELDPLVAEFYRINQNEGCIWQRDIRRVPTRGRC